MRNWRVLTAAIAAVAAVLAAVGVYFYLNKADQRAESKLDQVSVLVASQPIPAGTTASAAEQHGWLTFKKVARKDVPPGTLTSTNGLDKLVAAYAIDNGGYITPGSFVTSTQVNDFAGTLDKGTEAISISVDEQHGVAGFVQPGDHVSLIVSASKTNTGVVTGYMVPGLKVLGVGTTSAVPSAQAASQPASNGTTATTQPASTGNKGLITLEVTPHEALQIAHAYALDAVVYVTLEPSHFDGKSFNEPTALVDAGSIFHQPVPSLAQSSGQAGK